MYVNIKNENYGEAVATYGDYVVVANPPNLRWNVASASVYFTGSIDYFRYNKATDQHDLIGTSYKNKEEINVVLATELANAGITGPEYNIDTETDIDLLIDQAGYTGSLEDGFGQSLDMYEKLLVVGAPYSTQFVKTDVVVITASLSSVEIHDLARTEYTSFSTQSAYVTSLINPDVNVTNSFGIGVSINNSWIAVGSPYVSASKGRVYMYKNISTGSNYTWSYFQTIEASGSLSDAMFGWDLKLNKQSGSLSNSMVVGCGNRTNNQAYYFEFVSGSWQQTYVFLPTTTILPLTFGGYTPYNPTLNITSAFGYAVSTFNNTVVIGAPLDRLVYEFSGSTQYEQGAAYVYEKCTNLPYTKFELVLKTYGNSNTLKSNRMGYSVDVFNTNAVVGIPKINNETLTSCYIEGTLNQLHQCTNDLSNTLNGQMMLLQKNTASLEWDITNVYQKKKNYLSPYRNYGNDVSIDGRSIVVGAPLNLYDNRRSINLETTSSNGIELDDMCGKAYIYNLANLRHEFHVGNVFYRNGKIVIMTSGSAFNTLFFNPISPETYEYDIEFKGEHTIFEKQIICDVAPGEFNVSTNPSAIVKPMALFDINGNGMFDFQDVDVILQYMQYKNTSFLGLPVSTDWSSSVVTADDEKSLLTYYKSQAIYNSEINNSLVSASIIKWETIDTSMQDVLDINDDNHIDIRDMNIVWKYFSNRLSQANYATYITPASNLKLFSDVIDYLDNASQRNVVPQIKTDFLDYERFTSTDKTGSFLAPMVTTIGLYAGLDLVCIAKLGSPIKLIPELPFNFVVKMDY
jgi:hypothetical protein